MNTDCQYELLDFGRGRKLERFGDWILDRPSPPAASHKPANPGLWAKANLRFILESQHQGNWWVPTNELQQPKVSVGKLQLGRSHPQFTNWQLLEASDRFQWQCRLPFGVFNLKCTPFGHVGLFPEHFRNWQSIAETSQPDLPPEYRVLSLFAYTGASTVCFSKHNAFVTHVEAAKNVVQWARMNFDASFGTDTPPPVRWLCEDVSKYVKREVKRGSQYEGIILDPPTYGHGPKGQVWKIQQDLPGLLEDLAQIVSDRLKFVLLTAHSTDYDPASLRKLFQRHFLSSFRLNEMPQIANGKIKCGKNLLSVSRERDQRGLDAGVELLWLAN